MATPEMDRGTKVQLILWVPLVMVLGGYSAKAALEYAFDLRALYLHPKATKLHREAAWSNLRNECGRLLIAEVLLVLASDHLLSRSGRAFLPQWFIVAQLFTVANYKLWCSVKDRRLRGMLLERDELARREEAGD
jgi:hypothetical protein